MTNHPSTIRLTQHNALQDRLARASELTITVTGRKSGRAIAIPIWFVVEEDTLYLLPVHGSDTQWYKNVLNNPMVRIEAAGAAADLKAIPVTEAKQLVAVTEKFRGKYGAGDVKKYYSKFDVALIVHLGGASK